MKYLNKNKIHSKKKKFFTLKKSFSMFLVLLIFFIGIWTERFDLTIHIKNLTNEIIQTGANRLHSTFNKNKKKLIIDINYKNYLKILSSREKSIKSFRASENIHEWVPATMVLEDKKYKIKIKLKGVHKDHWVHPTKWSFKIKLTEDKSIDGIKRFSIQQPKTRNYLYEWLFTKVLEKENLISHRTKYLETIVNGENLGIYFFEEQHSKQLIENNKRREGPIIGLDKNLWIKEVNNLDKLSVNVLEDTFWRAKIKPVQFDVDKIGTEQELYLKNAISLLEDFRKGQIKLDQAFDLKQLATLMAIKAIFGATEFDWRDIKFYYNPITSLLEPIGREVHVGDNFNPKTAWWIKGNKTGFVYSKDQNDFINLFYNDNNFYKFYLSELNRLTKDGYLEKIIDENENAFISNKKILQLNFPLINTFSFEHLQKVKSLIKQTLNPIQGINVYFTDYQNDNILLSIQNTQRLPVEIKGIRFNNGQNVDLNKTIIAMGKEHNKPLENNIINIPCNKLENNRICKNFVNKKLITKNNKLIFNILGQDIEMQSEILQFYPLENIKAKKKIISDVKELKKLSFIKINDDIKEINFDQNHIVIDKRIIIPSGYSVNFNPGTKITLEKEGQIISYSPIFMNGEKKKPIIFTGDLIKNKNNKYGNGLTIINASSKSIIKNTFFKNLKSPLVATGEGLLGSINIYKSDIVLENCRFNNNEGEDFLNIISSNFLIKNILISEIEYDAIDFDFSNGSIEDASIINTGNDALDFSGSNVVLKNIKISNAGDKGISAGERSTIQIKDLLIMNANIAIASKDLSELKIENINIKSSNIAAAAYQKKSEYGPGMIKIDKINISDTKELYLAQKDSLIKVDNNIINSTDKNYAAY